MSKSFRWEFSLRQSNKTGTVYRSEQVRLQWQQTVRIWRWWGLRCTTQCCGIEGGRCRDRSDSIQNSVSPVTFNVQHIKLYIWVHIITAMPRNRTNRGDSKIMSILKVISAVILFCVLYELYKGPDPIPELPETWWGPGIEKNADINIRPFRITFSDKVIYFTICMTYLFH